MRMAVVLPAPFGPSSTVILPPGTRRPRRSRARVVTELLHHALEDDDGIGLGHRSDGSGGFAHAPLVAVLTQWCRRRPRAP